MSAQRLQRTKLSRPKLPDYNSKISNNICVILTLVNLVFCQLVFILTTYHHDRDHSIYDDDDPHLHQHPHEHDDDDPHLMIMVILTFMMMMILNIIINILFMMIILKIMMVVSGPTRPPPI